MNIDNWQQVKKIFDSALSLSAAEREEYLSKACDDDAEVRQEVDDLLLNYHSTFLEEKRSFSDNLNEQRFTTGGFVDRFEIVGLLGTGGMGEVYLARDNKLDRRVAIKVLSANFQAKEANIDRFVREAKAASALNHPNILTIYEIGETGDSHFIVSEFVEGKTLRELLCGRSFTVSETVDIATQAAEALSAAHASKIVHRDIKPENIIVRDDGLVKVLDFGLAKLLPSEPSFIGLEDDTIKASHTTEGLILGTVSYMSPEQACGERVDERTDIFSLGVVIFEMITGRTPFAADSISERLANLINKEPPRLSELVPNIPDELQQIVSKMLEKRKDDRYGTVSKLLGDLKRVGEHITYGSTLHRTDEPESYRVTAVLPQATGEQRPVMLNGEDSRTSRFKPVFLVAGLALVLIAAAGLGWYWNRPAAQPVSITSLAILPLRSADAGENVLGFGIADAVIRRISQTGALKVRPTSAIKRYVTEDTDALTAAQQLNVDAVLEGTVQRASDRVRIAVNLLNVQTGASLWSENFDIQLTDIFAVQDKVAEQVAARLQLQLDPKQQERLAKRTTSDPVAYEFYVKGVYAFNQRRFDDTAREQIESTIDLLKKAVERDPNYAIAHAKLAHAYAWKGLFVDIDDQPRQLSLANEEITKADLLDPQLADTHLARFRILFSESGGWRIDQAVREILKAQAIDPNTGHEELADMYLHIGLEDLMDREIRRALEIDPTSDWVKLQMLTFYQVLNRYDDYLRVRNEYFPEQPVSSAYYLVKGDLVKFKEVLKVETGDDPRGPDPVLTAMVLAIEGRKRESEAMVPGILKVVRRMSPAYHHTTYDIACIYAMNANPVEAVKRLRETAAIGNPSYTLFNRDPFLDKVRQSPEFIQFMAELKPHYERYRSEFR